LRLEREVQTILFTRYYQGHEIKENEMGGAYSKHVEVRNVYKICPET
jgi:hypothetical protein